jgi:hypothetical protein
VITGFDTHMILETVPAPPSNTRTCTRTSTGHHATMLAVLHRRHIVRHLGYGKVKVEAPGQADGSGRPARISSTGT